MDPSLFCLVAGNYRNDQIQRLPSPVEFGITLGGQTPNPSNIADYQQVLHIRDGLLTTHFNWRAAGKIIPVTITTFPSRSNPHLVVTHVSAPATPGLKVAHGIGSLPPAPGVPGAAPAAAATAVSPGPAFFETAGAGGPAVAMQAASVITPGSRFEWTGYTAVFSSDDGPDPRALAAAQLKALTPGSYTQLLSAHTAAWHKLWQSDIAIDGDTAAQTVVHAALFYLLENTRAGSRWSIPPMGLSNDNWGGHIFWDAPMWMFPALILLHPDEARPMVDYAVRMLPQAEKIAAGEGKPGASYPWESARSGQEDAAAPFNRERHVTADMAHMAWRYYLVTGDRLWLRTRGYPVIQSAARYWVSRMEKGADGLFHISGVVGPDENAGIVTDDAFTNGVVIANLHEAVLAARELGLSAPPEWAARAADLSQPFDRKQGIYLAHDGYHGEQVKQADPSLLIYPLGLVMDPATIRKMLAYYPPRIEGSGPAMTHSIYAAIAAQQGMTEKALAFFRQSYEPFLMPPFEQISEKHSVIRRYCFMTGFGGLIQSVLYGFGGLTIEMGSLTARPHLPAGWKRLTIQGLRFHNKTYRLTATPGQSSLIPVASAR